ncbi:hypothetical protein CQZ93_16075 [Ochrobactrum vermis]|nr:hypothetical protein CQZ93_16075 [Ochrobactrum vermis]
MKSFAGAGLKADLHISHVDLGVVGYHRTYHLRYSYSTMDDPMKPNTYVATIIVACTLFLAWSILERARFELTRTETPQMIVTDVLQ